MQITLKDSKLLHSLKIQLLEYKTFECKLRHEGVINVQQNEGTDSAGVSLEPSIINAGFCSHNFRSVTINCAHTTATVKFKDLLRKISHEITDFKVDLYIKAIDDLLCGIYMLDHKKGSLEKEYALAEFYNKVTIEHEKLKLEISSLVQQHSKLVAELELLRQTIITDLSQFVD